MILLPPAIQAPEPPAPLPFASVRAQYKWSFAGAKQSGSGSLVVLMEPASGKLTLEVFSFGERIAFVDGDAAMGYRLLLPKQEIDRVAPALADLPLPFLPQAGSVDALARALALGEGAGLSVGKRDAAGPVKLRYEGQDDAGAPIEVSLTRKRWEPAAPVAGHP